MTSPNGVVDNSPLMSTAEIKEDGARISFGSSFNSSDKSKIEMKKKENETQIATNLDELLELTTAWRIYPLFITISMSFLWSLCALSAISPAFTAPAEGCTHNCSFYTIQQDFNLTTYFIEPAELTSSVYFLGNLLIGQFFATLADRFGRRPVIISSLFFTGIAGCLGSFATSFPLLLIARFIQGSCYTPLTTVNYVLSGESIPNRSQSLASIFFGISWVSGYCFLAPMSIWFPTWRTLQFATAVPNILVALIFILIIPESIAYSIERNNREAVFDWIQKNELLSCRKIEYDIDLVLDRKVKSTEKLTIWQMLRDIQNDRVMIRRMIVETSLWIFTFMTYCALSLTSTSVGNSDPIVSFLFSGIVELPAYFFIPILLKWSKRIPARFLCHLVGTGALFSMYFLDYDTPWHLPTWLLAKFCASCCYIFCFIYASELFPTYCRSCCMGVCSTFCNLGAIVAPHIFLMDLFIPSSQFLLLSFTGFTCTLLILLQPETKS